MHHFSYVYVVEYVIYIKSGRNIYFLVFYEMTVCCVLLFCRQ